MNASAFGIPILLVKWAAYRLFVMQSLGQHAAHSKERQIENWRVEKRALSAAPQVVRRATLRPAGTDREMDTRLARFLRRGLLLGSLRTSMTALLLCAPAHALSPDLKVSQFYH